MGPGMANVPTQSIPNSHTSLLDANRTDRQYEPLRTLMMCMQYFGVFNVGTPGKQYTGCFDTGSSDVWLPLDTCQSSSCETHDTYSPNASSTYQVSLLHPTRRVRGVGEDSGKDLELLRRGGGSFQELLYDHFPAADVGARAACTQQKLSGEQNPQCCL